MSKVLPILSKSDLLAFLPATTQPVKLLRAGDSAIHISIEHAILLVSRGRFAGEGTPKRVKKIWEINNIERPYTQWSENWRTAESAVLPPSPEYLRSVGA